MSIKDSALRFATAVENELIATRADQMEAAEALTVRINGVANHVKELRDEVGTLKETQGQMLEILIDIQRRVS
ncbi:hypothetical protein ACIBF6_14725 [Streptosporangium amethystogenes]|uniref:hypothetical protein n=1 Tax=Streptosporangium amethystogenes TaxID=2002 RepID=UPI0037B51891